MNLLAPSYLNILLAAWERWGAVVPEPKVTLTDLQVEFMKHAHRFSVGGHCNCVIALLAHRQDLTSETFMSLLLFLPSAEGPFMGALWLTFL